MRKLTEIRPIDRFKKYEKFKKKPKPKAGNFSEEYEKALKEYCKKNKI